MGWSDWSSSLEKHDYHRIARWKQLSLFGLTFSSHQKEFIEMVITKECHWMSYSINELEKEEQPIRKYKKSIERILGRDFALEKTWKKRMVKKKRSLIELKWCPENRSLRWDWGYDSIQRLNVMERGKYLNQSRKKWRMLTLKKMKNVW